MDIESQLNFQSPGVSDSTGYPEVGVRVGGGYCIEIGNHVHQGRQVDGSSVESIGSIVNNNNINYTTNIDKEMNRNHNTNKIPLTVILPTTSNTSFYIPTTQTQSVSNNVTVMTLPAMSPTNKGSSSYLLNSSNSNTNFNSTPNVTLLDSQKLSSGNNNLSGGTISNNNNNSSHNRIDDELTMTLDNNPPPSPNMNFNDSNISCVTTVKSNSLPPVPEFQQQQGGTMDKTSTTTVFSQQNKNHISSIVGTKSVSKTSGNGKSDEEHNQEVRWPAPGIVAISPSISFDMMSGVSSTSTCEDSKSASSQQTNILDLESLSSSPPQACSQQQNNNNNIIVPSIDLLNFDSSLLNPNPSVGGDSITNITLSQHNNTNNINRLPLTPVNSCSSYCDDLTHISPIQKSASLKLNQDDFLDFEMSCSSTEIAKVLDSFNAILENEDNYFPDYNDLDLTPGPDSYRFTNNLNVTSVHDKECLRLVDNFANLLIGDEDNLEEDLLIIVDGDGDGEKNCTENRDESLCPSGVILSSSASGSSSHSGHDTSNNTKEINYDPNDKDLVDQQTIDEDDEDLESEYPDPDTEGYESDRPMVRASMRKLRPVLMVPMPVISNPIQESPFPSPSHSSTNNNTSDSPVSQQQQSVGLATTINSPVTNRIIVTSLINTILNGNNNSPSSEPTNVSEVVNNQNNPIYGEIIINPLTTPATESAGHEISTESTSNGGTNTVASVNTGPTTTISGTNIVSETPSNANTNITSTDNTTLTDNGNNPTSTTTTGTTASSGIGRNAGRTSPLLGPGLRMPAGRWPHRLSSVLALIGCTLGLNNICRFSLLSVEYGWAFILQFLFLSLIFGIPLFTFHMSIGQYLSSGIIDMWRISPIFQGIGIAVVISQAMIGIYTAVGISWIFHYFRDSFITRYDQYRWGKCFREYRGSACDAYLPFSNLTNFTESVPDYFHGVVLQRSSPEYPSSSSLPSSLKFTVAFNLAVVWMLVFVSLSKGLKSYGKVVHGFVIIPVAALLVLASKMVGLVPADQAGALFGQTAWSNFFFNTQTWIVAAREAFFTWGLLGACVMQVTSHNRFTHSLKSDASIVVLITTFVLLLSAFLGNACYSVLLSHGYSYVPSSFESNKTYMFLMKTSNFPQTPGPEPALTPAYMNQHISFLMGVRILKPSDSLDGGLTSGYTTLRLATELFPATMSILGHTGLSPFWTVLFYFTFILFGIAQQIAIWHCVIRGVISIKSKVLCCWEITITFCVCAIGFILGLPLCTELGIFITYFMDYAIGSGWWIMVLYLLELVAVFIVRGAPYCGENIVTVLMTGSGKLIVILAPLVSFTWNVILPVAMLVLSIASFKSGNMRELYDWNAGHGWPSWTKEIGSFLQLLPILAVPIVAIIKCCLYLTTGPPDMFERIQQLYRPSSRGLFGRALSAHLNANTPANDYPPGTNNGSTRSGDDPPKYTPPPSYSTATGAKIAKFLRNSFRRSLRRLAGGPSTSENPPPPNYASVVLEINNSQQSRSSSNSNGNSTQTPHSLVPVLLTPRPTDSSESQNQSNSKRYQIPLSQTLGRGESKERASLRRIASDITPRDIGRILRASFRRGSNNQDNTSINTTIPPPAFHIESDFTTLQFQNDQERLAQTQNNLNLSSESLLQHLQYPQNHRTVTVSTSNPPSNSHIDPDFLRVPQYHRSVKTTNNNAQLNVNVSVNVNGTGQSGHCHVYQIQNLYPNSNVNRIPPSYTHTRSSSSGPFMSTNSTNRGQNETTDSQLTLVHTSHSSSQNDLSNLDSITDFRLGGILNPSFQFSQQQLQRHDCSSSLNQSEA